MEITITNKVDLAHWLKEEFGYNLKTCLRIIEYIERNTLAIERVK